MNTSRIKERKRELLAPHLSCTDGAFTDTVASQVWALRTATWKEATLFAGLKPHLVLSFKGCGGRQGWAGAPSPGAASTRPVPRDTALASPGPLLPR